MESLEERISKAKTPLEYDKYKQYYFENKNLNDGLWKNGIHQWLFKFENNYGASVIKHYGSYGFEDDLFELAVIKFNDKGDWNLCYSTNVADDVIGYLTNNDVLRYLNKIKRL